MNPPTSALSRCKFARAPSPRDCPSRMHATAPLDGINRSVVLEQDSFKEQQPTDTPPTPPTYEQVLEDYPSWRNFYKQLQKTVKAVREEREEKEIEIEEQLSRNESVEECV